MARYLRKQVEGGTYFFTVVSHGRRRILTTPLGRRCLSNALRSVRRSWPFQVLAMVLLPDHLHTIWVLPEGDWDYSLRWQKVKEAFTKGYLSGGGKEGRRSISRQRHGERAVWQQRFWEHACRDEADLKRCADYLHWNPVKHGLASRAADYPWSSFHRFVSAGEYSQDWGGDNPVEGFELPE